MSNEKLPIKEIFYESLTLVKNNYVSLFKASLSYVIIVFSYHFYALSYVDFENLDFDMLSFFLLVLTFFTFVLVSVKFHRIFLLDEVENPFLIRWTSRENSFFGRWVVVFICSSLIAVPLVLLFENFIFSYIEDTYSTINSLILEITISYFIARFSLVLPATAINEKENSLKWSWRLSKNNSLRLFLLLGILPILSMTIFTLLSEEEYMIFNLLTTVLIMPFEICFLSLSYNFLFKASNQNVNMGEEYFIESSDERNGR